MTKIRYFKERRLGIERRSFTYSRYIPERRSGKDQREMKMSVKVDFSHENSWFDREAA